MIKYYYVRFKYLKSERAELITAAKAKGVIFQLQKMYDKNIEIVKLVEISKEKYDRLTLWHKLRYEHSSSHSSGRLARVMTPLAAINAFTSAIGSNYSYRDVYSNFPVSAPTRRRGKGRG